VSEIDLKALRADLLAEEIKKTRLEASYEALKVDMAKIELVRNQRQERNHAAQSERARIYTFHGPVGSMSSANAVEELGYWSRRDPGEPMTIVFNSPGGSVFEGLAFFDFIQKLKREGHHITTKGTGMAASMGGILLQAGDERVMDPRAWLLIHEVSTLVAGKMADMDDALKFAKRLQASCMDILAERSTMTAKQIERKIDKTDWWLSAEEALALGFIDRVE
jgi:ATP-dependent Clp endopeptidase proteolytic subunit ClpP